MIAKILNAISTLFKRPEPPTLAQRLMAVNLYDTNRRWEI